LAEIKVSRQSLVDMDSGGGYRSVEIEVVYDDSLSRYQQRSAVIYETLASVLDYVLGHDQILDITNLLNEALTQWEGQDGR